MALEKPKMNESAGGKSRLEKDERQGCSEGSKWTSTGGMDESQFQVSIITQKPTKRMTAKTL